MILRPRTLIAVTCATWVAVMGGCLYASAIYSAYERREVLAGGRDRDLANGVNQGLDGGGASLPSLSGGQEPPSLPGNPVPLTSGKGGANPPAPGFERESSFTANLLTRAVPGRAEVGVSMAPRMALSRGVRYEPGSGSPSSLGLTESRAGALRQMATNAARLCGVEPALFHRQIGRESGWNPRARSSSGALGLGQLMPAAAREMGVTDRLDPWQNLVGSACYLRRQFDRFGTWPKALHAYVAGPNRVRTTQAHRDYATDIIEGSAQ